MGQDTRPRGNGEVAGGWVDHAWDAFRCRTCQRLLLKITPAALKPGAALEIKCACKTMNYLMGA